MIDTLYIFHGSRQDKVKFIGVDADISRDMKDDDKNWMRRRRKRSLKKTKDLQEATSKSNLKVNVESLKTGPFLPSYCFPRNPDVS